MALLLVVSVGPVGGPHVPRLRVAHRQGKRQPWTRSQALGQPSLVSVTSILFLLYGRFNSPLCPEATPRRVRQGPGSPPVPRLQSFDRKYADLPMPGCLERPGATRRSPPPPEPPRLRLPPCCSRNDDGEGACRADSGRATFPFPTAALTPRAAEGLGAAEIPAEAPPGRRRRPRPLSPASQAGPTSPRQRSPAGLPGRSRGVIRLAISSLGRQFKGAPPKPRAELLTEEDPQATPAPRLP